jgi:anti-sigma B factor antagonist
VAAHTITVEILELDAWTADEFVRQLGAFEPTEHVVVDMRRVQFCDSSGIGALITAWRQHSAAGGSLCVINAADNVARGFRVLGLTFVEADPAAHR